MNNDWTPKLVTDIPGPKSRELLKRKETYVSRGVSTTLSLFVEEAKGALVKDVDGNVFIDFAGGIGTINVGHCPPSVVEAIQKQSGKYIHTCWSVVMYEPYVALAEKLAEITPGNFPKKTMFANSGAEAVENAVKIARKYTGRTGIVALENAFHGRTLMTMTLTSKVRPYKFGFGPFAPDVYKIPSAYCYRCPYGATYPNCNLECAERLKHFFVSEFPAENIAAVIAEPVQGEGGFIIQPKEFLERIRDITKENGILYIDDEVQTGFGRTGSMFALDHYGIEPDLVTMAKSLAAGMPLSAVTGRAEVMDAPAQGEIGGTFGGNPIACVAGLAVIKMFETQNLANKAEHIGSKIEERLKEMQGKYPLIGDVRRLGAMVAIELVKDRKTKKPAKEETSKLAAACHKKGLIILTAGVYGNVIRFLVPLVAEDDLINQGLDILEKSFVEIQPK